MNRKAYRHQMPTQNDPIFGSGDVSGLLRSIRSVERANRIGARYQDKKAACEAHSGKRVAERYGFSLTRIGRREIERQILLGAALPLYKESCSKMHYAVRLCGAVLPIVWDKVRKVIVTVLPIKALDPYMEKVSRHWTVSARPTQQISG